MSCKTRALRLLPLLLCLLLLLSACAPTAASAPFPILVCIEDCEGVTVLDNGQRVAPGSEVHFTLETAPDRIVEGVLGAGDDYVLRHSGTTWQLTLPCVRYPTSITLLCASYDIHARSTRTIFYDANLPGQGEDLSYSETMSIQEHPRPNTSRGEALFRDGFTLVSWNTAPDGSGLRVGLGSRVTVPLSGLTLYAQYLPWTAEDSFSFEEASDGIHITGCHAADDPLVIPSRIRGLPVVSLESGAFQGVVADTVVLPPTLREAEPGAFQDCMLSTLVLFDSIESIPDAAFQGCQNLCTLRINAMEDPYGFSFRRESLFADKIDLLITRSGLRKLVFYGGCNVWYNLIGEEAVHRFGDSFEVVNLGLNGTVNAYVQMEILRHFLDPGDVFFHAPEISSTQQLLLNLQMYDGDDMLWSGLEYNYDLFSLVDLRKVPGALDSLCHYLSQKEPGGSYLDVYRDSSGVAYMDATGSIPFLRTKRRGELTDSVRLSPGLLEEGLHELNDMYENLSSSGVTVYVSSACIDLPAVPQEEQGNVALMDSLLRAALEDGPARMISSLSDYLYVPDQFYDTHYHLLTQFAYENTEKWLSDLEEQLQQDALIR
ncbi:MAG: leucine-rich repeat protein [Clostridia bacterium]|nr:leucine-rich repeat protein [Clostridia bacterium]